MKAAFIHDHNFVYDPTTKVVYDGSGGAFDANLWSRYLAIFDNLVVIGREIASLPNKLVVSSSPNVTFRLIDGASGVRNVLKNKKRIRRELMTAIGNVDFVIIRLPSLLGRWAFDICQVLDKKCVLEIVGDPYEAYRYHGNWIGKIIAPLERFRLQKIVGRARYVIYVTQNNLQQTYPSYYVSSSISNVRLERVASREEVRAFYSEDSSIFRIGMIGSFHVKYKGHIEALKALRWLKDRGYKGLELQLVGSGDPKWVENLVSTYGLEDEVKIIGALRAGEEGIFPFLDKLDLYIHPSRTEGLPRVVIEAMSRGKICLGSNVGGTSELLGKEYIHSAGDWQMLAKQIGAIMNHSKDMKSEIATGNLDVASEYLESILQQRRVAFINSVLIGEI